MCAKLRTLPSETVDPVRDAYNSAFGETYGPALRDASAVGVGMAEAAGRFAATLTNGRNSTEVVQRWMSNEELTSVQETGLLRGGRPGRTFVTDNANSSAQRARLRLALPQTPDVRVTVEVPSGLFSKPTPVLPYKNMPGGGMERVTTKPVPVLKIIKID